MINMESIGSANPANLHKPVLSHVAEPTQKGGQAANLQQLTKTDGPLHLSAVTDS